MEFKDLGLLVIDEAVKEMIEKSNENPRLLKWISRYVEEKINHYIRLLERRDDSIKSIYPIKNKNDLAKKSVLKLREINMV